MPSSNFNDRERIMDRIDEIALVLANTHDAEQIAEFLRSILTESEVKEVSSRWELVKLLNEGMSQRKISEKLGLSLCKITRGSKELKKDPSFFKQMVDKYSDLD
jgi:TrpR family trp operon transcriptional repressor